MLCGTSVTECSGLKWMNYMGNINNGQSPFEIHYKDTKDGLKEGQSLYKYEPVPCNADYKGTVCSCQDCTPACHQYPSLPPAYREPEVFGMKVSLFTVIVAFCVFTVGFVTLVTLVGLIMFFIRRSGDSEESVALLDKDDADDIWDEGFGLRRPPCGVCSLGNQFDYLLRSCFFYWGCLVAKVPWLILIIAFILILPFCFGIFLMKVTTDPVKLWSAPENQARIEKNYFDEHFGPFYRNEMLIFTSDNLTSTNYTLFQSIGDKSGFPVEFGHMFQKDILQEVMKFYLNGDWRYLFYFVYYLDT